MKARYVNELTEGSRVDSTFVIRSKEIRAARNGDAYLSLTLADRSGAVPAVQFRPGHAAATAPVGSVVSVTGTVTTFRGVRRISVEAMAPSERWDSEDFIAPGARPVEELVAEFAEVVRSVCQPGLRAVLSAVFGDKVFFKSFSTSPASQGYHHAYIGGLLEHTLSVASLCSSLSERYSGADRDLLVTAALLHDVGKVDELSVDTAIAYTDDGRLLGHVVLGMMRVRGAVERSRLEARLARQLEHALLSHHGELEWGSPKRPSTLEALLLHHVDNLDAKAAGFASLLLGASRAEEAWTDASNLFRRPLFAPKAAEDDRVSSPQEDESATRLSA